MSYYAPRRQPPRRRIGPWLVGLAVVALIIFLVINNVFSVRTVEVQGNRYVTAEEVIAASGIKRGDNIFSINTTDVRNGINNNRYLDYVGLWRSFPSTVILTVTEHTPRAKMAWMGMLVIIGDNGIVLEQTAEIDIAVHVPEIVGMTVNLVRVGQPLIYGVLGQGEAIDRVISELELQGIGAAIAQINIASPQSMYLVTEDGLQITIGNDEDLPMKFALIREVLPRIQTMGSVTGGTLDVSTAKAADYRAPN